jgi:hypothetical protein
MPTYYVSQTTGLNTNNGTSPVTPWQTLAFALGAASGTNPGIVGGDIVYVAPGTYNEAVTLGFTSPASTVQIIGDPTNSRGFPNVSGGVVQWSNTNACLTAVSKNNISISNIYFERFTQNSAVSIVTTTCYDWSFTKCVIISGITGTSVSPTPLNWTITKSIICASNSQNGIGITTGTGTAYNINLNINDCLLFSTTGGGAVSNIGVTSGVGNGGIVSNCTMMHPNVCAQMGTSNTTNKLMFQNCLFLGASAFYIFPSGTIDCQYNRYVCSLGFNGVSGTGSTTGGLIGLDFGYARLTNFGLNDFFGSYTNSVNIAFGIAANAPTSDMYGVTWLGNPDTGAIQRSALSNFQPPTAPYAPAERNISTYTISPGSTSQSIEIYLGSTGLTATSASLAARYNRSRSASVVIPLVTRTIIQPWVSGGFAEVDSVGMPGIYRLDLPDEALVDGADDVTVNVRGAFGTLGAVITINLKAVESSLISMGPYKVIADGLGSDQPLDIMQGVQAPVSVQVVDVNENGIDITGATVQAKAYNSAGTLVATYTCTPTYAADGRCTFLLTTAVTNVAGVYSVTITRAVGGNVVVFGPLKVMVRAN